MAEILLDKLWQQWRELAKRELEIQAQYKPLIDEYAAANGKRMALENLMLQGQLPTINQEISSKWEVLRKGAQMPSTE